MGIHCRPWNSISHVVNSGCSCWDQECCDWDGNQLVDHSVQHTILALHQSLVGASPSFVVKKKKYIYNTY